MAINNGIKPAYVVISLYDFHNNDDSNDKLKDKETILSFQKDTIIYVLNKEEDSNNDHDDPDNYWRDGVIFTNGNKLKRGWFPINYCEKVNIINDNYYCQQQKINPSNIITNKQLEDIIKNSSFDTQLELKKSGIRLIKNVIRYKFSNDTQHDSNTDGYLGFDSSNEIDDTIYTLEKIHKTIYYQNLNKYVFYHKDDHIELPSDSNVNSITKDEEYALNQRNKRRLSSSGSNNSASRKNSQNTSTYSNRNNSAQFSMYLPNDPNIFFIDENKNIESFEQLSDKIMFHLNNSKEAIIGKENLKNVVAHSAGTIKEDNNNNNNTHNNNNNHHHHNYSSSNSKTQGFMNKNLLNWSFLKYYKGSYYDFNYNLNLVSKNSLLMQNALRIYSKDKNKNIDSKTRKRIRQLLKILNHSFFTIAVNTYLYFNSDKFDITSSLNSSLIEKTMPKSYNNNWKEPFAPLNTEIHNTNNNNTVKTPDSNLNRNDFFWTTDEVDPKFKEGNKRNSSAATIKLSEASKTESTPNSATNPNSSSFSSSSPASAKQNTLNIKKLQSHPMINSQYEPSVTSSNFLSNVSTKGVHIDLLIKSIFEEYNKYEIVLSEIFQILIQFQNQEKTPANKQSPSVSSMQNRHSSTDATDAQNKSKYIPQLTPHFLKDSFDKNYWDNIDHKQESFMPSNDEPPTSFSEKPLSSMTTNTENPNNQQQQQTYPNAAVPITKTPSSNNPSKAMNLITFDNIKSPKFSYLHSNSDHSVTVKKEKNFVTKKFVKEFKKDLMIIIEKTNHAVTIIEQPQTSERDIKFVYYVNTVLAFNTNLLQKLDNLDFELYRYLVALEFTPAEDGLVEYKELSQWQKYLLDDMRLVLLEYSEAKQKYHDMVALGVIYTQQICFQDPFVFSTMRKDYFYDDNAVVKDYNTANDKSAKKLLDEDVLPIPKNATSGSMSTLNMISKKYSKSCSEQSLTSLQKSKQENMEMVLSLLSRQMIFQDVEINTTDYVDPAAELKCVMKDFLNNFNQLIAIVDQIASITQSFLTSALSFINNPKVATLINLINKMKENGDSEDEIDDYSTTTTDEQTSDLTSQEAKNSSEKDDGLKLLKSNKKGNSSFFEFQKSKEDFSGSIVLNPSYSPSTPEPSSSTILPNFSRRDSTSLTNNNSESTDDDEWLLQNEYDDFLIYDDKTGQVKTGTKIALVEHLTSHISTDRWFNEVMFQHFKTMFDSTFEFFNFIVMRYNLMPQEGLNYRQYDSWVKKKLNIVKVSCYMVLFEFLENYWYPQYLENDLLRFSYLLEVFKDDKMPDVDRFGEIFNKKIVEPLRANISDKNFNNKDKEAMSKKYATKVIPSHLYLWKTEDKLCPIYFNLFSFSAKTIAENLTIKEFDIFRNISSLECLDRVLNNKHTWQGGSPNIKVFINMSNMITNFIIYEIVKEKQINKRVETLERCIDIVEELLNLNNFSAMTSIVSALSSSPVFRLKKTWAALPEDYKEKFSKLSKVMDSNKNFNTYRELFNAVKLKAPALPFFGVYLSDLIFTQMGNSDLVKVAGINEPLINFNKRAKLQLIIKEIKQLQQFSYNETLKMDDNCMWFIETYCYKDPEHSVSKKDVHHIPDTDQLYNQSLAIEPKAATTTPQTIKNVNYLAAKDREMYGRRESELRKSILQSKVAEDSLAGGRKSTFILQDKSGNSSSNSSINSTPHQQHPIVHGTTSHYNSGIDYSITTANPYSKPGSFSNSSVISDPKLGHKKSDSANSTKSGGHGDHSKVNNNLLSTKQTKNAAFKKLVHYEK